MAEKWFYFFQVCVGTTNVFRRGRYSRVLVAFHCVIENQNTKERKIACQLFTSLEPSPSTVQWCPWVVGQTKPSDCLYFRICVGSIAWGRSWKVSGKRRAPSHLRDASTTHNSTNSRTFPNTLCWICAVECTKSQNLCCHAAREISNWIGVVRASR